MGRKFAFARRDSGMSQLHQRAGRARGDRADPPRGDRRPLGRRRGGLHYVVDYKSTSKGGEVGLGVDWQGGYRRQVEFYQWLLRGPRPGGVRPRVARLRERHQGRGGLRRRAALPHAGDPLRRQRRLGRAGAARRGRLTGVGERAECRPGVRVLRLRGEGVVRRLTAHRPKGPAADARAGRMLALAARATAALTLGRSFPRNAKPRAESAGPSVATHRGARRPVVAGFKGWVSEDSSIGQPSFHEHEIYGIERLQLTPFSRPRQDASATK